jgi:hypothetical protein
MQNANLATVTVNQSSTQGKLYFALTAINHETHTVKIAHDEHVAKLSASLAKTPAHSRTILTYRPPVCYIITKTADLPLELRQRLL